MSQDSQRQKYIAALVRERDGYLAGGHPKRAAEVDEELQRIAGRAEPPAKRAQTRVTKGAERRA